MRTTSQSDSTRVPPVTALKSPPLSRITGALSPVIALSSTEATPSTTSPSPGMSSPGLDEHDVAAAQLSTTAPSSCGAPRCGSRELLRDRVLARALAQAVGLRLAAALRHRLGEVREQHA